MAKRRGRPRKEESANARRCCICGVGLKKEEYGNNPSPLALNDNEECCDACDENYVLPARLYELNGRRLSMDDVLRIRANAKIKR